MICIVNKIHGFTQTKCLFHQCAHWDRQGWWAMGVGCGKTPMGFMGDCWGGGGGPPAPMKGNLHRGLPRRIHQYWRSERSLASCYIGKHGCNFTLSGEGGTTGLIFPVLSPPPFTKSPLDPFVAEEDFLDFWQFHFFQLSLERETQWVHGFRMLQYRGRHFKHGAGRVHQLPWREISTVGCPIGSISTGDQNAV